MQDSVDRFSSRVENYVKYRPRYPRAVIETLTADCGLTPAARVADIGSGPGNLAELFLENGNIVYAVEPNPAMRDAAERLLSEYPGFRSVAGRAEATPLPDASVDFVTAGQAFHWFDREKARAEFARILRPGGWVVIAWNERETIATPFMAAYEALGRRFAAEYEKVDHRLVTPEILEGFFGPEGFRPEGFRPEGFRKKAFENYQEFDYTSLAGQLLSSSYAPEAGHPNYAPMLAELSKVFAAHQVNGCVRFEYTTSLYCGHLT